MEWFSYFPIRVSEENVENLQGLSWFIGWDHMPCPNDSG